MPRVVVYPQQPPTEEPADIKYASKRAQKVAAEFDVAAEVGDPYHYQRGAPARADAESYVPSCWPEPGTVIPSFWRDLILVAESEQRSEGAFDHPVLRGRDQGDPDRPDSDRDLAQAHYRLEQARKAASFDREYRDIVASGTSFLPPAGAVPGYVGAAFATAARAEAPLSEVIPRQPHPGSLTVSTPRIVSGAAVNVQTAENASVTEQDATSALQQAPTATIAGQLDLSRQLYDFSNPGADVWVAAELGADYAAKLETQLISGLGSSGQTLGLRNVTGVTAVTHTNASPTAATNYAKLGDLIQQTQVASGIRPDTLLLAPRRKEFVESKLGWVPQWFGLTVIESAQMPLNLGAGTNQDLAIDVNRNELTLYEEPMRVRAYPEVGSSTLTVRLSVWGYAALLANRKPSSIGISTGTEWIAPTF